MVSDIQNAQYWEALDSLLQSKRIIIDRPKGTPHPRFPDLVYPVDYGYLAETMSADGHETDVWRGTSSSGRVDAIACTVDLHKMDAEVKLLVCCTPQELELIYRVHNGEWMHAIIIARRDSVAPSDK